MASIPPNTQVIRKTLNGPRAVYSILKHPKLYLATDGNGSGSWRIKYRAGRGTKAPTRWHTISNDARNADFEDVSRKANDLLNNLTMNGVDPKTTRPKTQSNFNDLFEGWLNTHAKVNKRSWQHDEDLYNRHIKSRIGSEPVPSINRPRVVAVLDDIAQKVTPLQANRCQSIISAVFSWALDDAKVDNHPALRIRRRGAETRRALVMTDNQLRAFWQQLQHLDPKPRNIVKLLLLTGTRLSEVAEAELIELQLDGPRPTWTIPPERTKNRLTHVLPLLPMAKAVFEEALRLLPGHPYVFPARRKIPQAFNGNEASRLAKDIFREIGVGTMRLHDLRHQTATGMAQCRVPLEIRQWVQNQITGRKQSIGSVYDQHDYTEEKHRALALWEKRIAAILANQPLPTEDY